MSDPRSAERHDRRTSDPITARLEWIGLRPERRATVVVVDAAEAVVGQGLDGDRFVGRDGGAGTRQVTFVRREDLATAAARLGRDDALDPADLRRNFVLRGLPDADLRGATLRVAVDGGDDVVLEVTGGCPPCERMDETVGPGGRDALDGLAGWTARVVHGGRLRVGAAATLDAATGSTSSDADD